MTSKYDSWLTRQPQPGVVHVTKPESMFLICEPDMTDDYEDEYPVDEWKCRDCQEPLGFYISGDHGGGWNDAYWLVDTDEHLCEDCFTEVTSHDVPEQPDCDVCGALAGDEHGAACVTERCANCERMGASVGCVQGGLCDDCFAAMPMDEWVSTPWETR